jgi:hypothetical protein
VFHVQEILQRVSEHMFPRFKVSDSAVDGKMIRNKSMLNIFKHMLVKKEVYSNPAKNFCLMIYLLLYRISLEIGISVLTPTEAVIMSVLYLVVIFSAVNQGSRVLFTVLKKACCLAADMLWIYMNLDEIKRVMEETAHPSTWRLPEVLSGTREHTMSLNSLDV